MMVEITESRASLSLPRPSTPPPPMSPFPVSHAHAACVSQVGCASDDSTCTSGADKTKLMCSTLEAGYMANGDGILSAVTCPVRYDVWSLPSLVRRAGWRTDHYRARSPSCSCTRDPIAHAIRLQPGEQCGQRPGLLWNGRLVRM